MDFQITESKSDKQTSVLALTGRLTAATSPQLRDKIKQLTENSTVYIVLDMKGVPFIDSSGLSALVSGLKSTREGGGWLKLAGVTPTVMQTLKLTNLDRVIISYPSVESALHS